MQMTGQNSGVVADYRLTRGSVLRILGQGRAQNSGADRRKLSTKLQIAGREHSSMLVRGGSLQNPHRLRFLEVSTEC